MKIIFLFFLVLVSPFALAESTIVYGKGFSFSFNLPEGWICNCDGKEAAKLDANALVYKKGETWKSAQALIFFRVNRDEINKVDSTLKADMENYKIGNPDTLFEDLQVKHSSYKTASKIFIKPKVSYEYVTFVLPQPFNKNNISSSMNTQKRPASEEELKIYKNVTASITWLGIQKNN